MNGYTVSVKILCQKQSLLNDSSGQIKSETVYRASFFSSHYTGVCSTNAYTMMISLPVDCI